MDSMITPQDQRVEKAKEAAKKVFAALKKNKGTVLAAGVLIWAFGSSCDGNLATNSYWTMGGAILAAVGALLIGRGGSGSP